METLLYRAAQAYVDAGLSIFPVVGKKPNTQLLPWVKNEKGEDKQSWSPYQTRLPSKEEVKAFFTHPETTGLALVCGMASHGRFDDNVGLYIIDVDRLDWIEPFRERCGAAWQEVVVQRTGSGGVQLAMICQAASELRNQKLAMYANPNAGKPNEAPVLCGIESRGSGGYACGAPSRHPNGNYYELIQGKFTKLPLVSNDVVMQIITAAQHFNQVQAAVRNAAQHGVTRSKHFTRLTVPRLILDTFNAEMHIVDYLASHGYTLSSSGRMWRPMPDADRRQHMPGVLLSDDEDAAYFYSSNDPLNQYTNALGQPFHDRAGCAIGLEYGGDTYDFLESEGARYGINYHRPDSTEALLARHVPEVEVEDTDLEALTILGDTSSGVVFLVDNAQSAYTLRDQGVAAMYVPHDETNSYQLPSLDAYGDRYVWFGVRDGITDMYADMADAKVICAGGLNAAEMFEAGATGQDILQLLERAESARYAVGAAALRRR